MASHFELLPLELVALILDQLHHHDIANVRLTSRTMRVKATTPSFRDCFKTKDIHLNKESLEKFVRVTEDGGLGCLLENCTLTGLARSQFHLSRDDLNPGYRTTFALQCYLEEMVNQCLNENKPELFSLLCQAFVNLKKNTPTGSLASIYLRIQRVRSAHINKSVQEAYRTATRVFEMTIDALLASRLAVKEHLNIFGTQTGCGLQHDVFFKFMSQFFATDVFADLKKLTISLMPRLKTHYQDYMTRLKVHERYQDPDWYWKNKGLQGILGQRVLQGVVLELPRFMPTLQEFNFEWYDGHVTLDLDLYTEPLPPLPPLPNLATLVHSLQTVDLRGLFLDEEALLGFLQLVQPRHVTLVATRLLSGSYAPVFDYLTYSKSSVTSFRLDHLLLEQGSYMPVYYAEPDHLNHLTYATRILTRTGCAVKEKIVVQKPVVPLTTEAHIEITDARRRFRLLYIVTDSKEFQDAPRRLFT